MYGGGGFTLLFPKLKCHKQALSLVPSFLLFQNGGRSDFLTEFGNTALDPRVTFLS